MQMGSTYPDGLPGAGLLLLRTVSIGLLMQGAAYFAEPNDLHFLTAVFASLMIASGASLLVGYLTPVAGALAAFITLGDAFSWFPSPNPDLFGAKLSAASVTIVFAALVCLGPGAFSLDALRFGRREIVIPVSRSTNSRRCC